MLHNVFLFAIYSLYYYIFVALLNYLFIIFLSYFICTGLSAELYYVREGLVNEYALHFIVPVPANVRGIAFTWQSLSGRPVIRFCF